MYLWKSIKYKIRESGLHRDPKWEKPEKERRQRKVARKSSEKKTNIPFLPYSFLSIILCPWRSFFQKYWLFFFFARSSYQSMSRWQWSVHLPVDQKLQGSIPIWVGVFLGPTYPGVNPALKNEYRGFLWLSKDNDRCWSPYLMVLYNEKC